uniref:Lipopolysaccharide-induced tumor necrosis factor-alpha factor homolog n=1 Tax=Acanthochromis polyacanthus TaxID=80966 RepID=A0A3Q1FUV1_9TELE
MEPPSYEEASRQPPAGVTETFTFSPPPAYDASLPSPSTPPPTYGEAVGVTAPRRGMRTQTVVTQPQPVPVLVPSLRDSPALVRCPHCHHLVTTKVQYAPGKAAWCLLVCGFCLIPLMVRGLQDAHHSCPRCETPLHIYMR